MVKVIQTALAGRGCVKVIAGLDNFDGEQVARVVRAAYQGGATYVDIACDEQLIRRAKLSPLPVCVSAIEPEQLAQAVGWGADLVELGNFDCFYEQGQTFSAEQVLALTQRTRQLLPNTLLCVTVPHTLALVEQAHLAQQLVQAGADLLQTEGGTSSHPSQPGTLGLIQKAAPALAAAYELSRAVAVPVLCASGLSVVTVPMALAAGAQGVGIGRAVNRLRDEVMMIATVRALVEAAQPARLPVL
ncbi:DUF561 domain-containing protein [Candidatus Cyanaurora vandensis]|uniref:DUF561 domain-containing protein n=1 Tax=Candidatus Cyanaurora vandensis TaxID=2714958 RepID=UPI00257B58E8|nr:DUF561 domain-containing protein [Candidatus Cyanaurora vandensis]